LSRAGGLAKKGSRVRWRDKMPDPDQRLQPTQALAGRWLAAVRQRLPPSPVGAGRCRCNRAQR
jgi:hypothetical protein